MPKFRSDLPVEVIQQVGGDEMVARAARVSTGTDGALVLDGIPGSEAPALGGLISFLMRNRHGSPFEHGSITFRVEAPIFLAREFMRHRVGWSYNEESGRYKEMRAEFYLPDENRPLVQVGKAGAYTFEPGSPAMVNYTEVTLKEVYSVAWGRYTAMLENGVAKEVARMCLPVSVYTSFYATCNPRSLMHFLSLRTKDESATFPSFPMVEIARVATDMEKAFETHWPLTWEAWDRAGRVAP